MTFGQQPQNNGQYNPQYNTPDYNAAQQSGYGQQYAQSGYGQCRRVLVPVRVRPPSTRR